MQPAADRLKEVLDSVEIVDAKIPVVANVNAKPETKADEIRSQLVLQPQALYYGKIRSAV